MNNIIKGVVFMTYKQIETSREIRQWIGVATSAVLAAAALDKTYPELRTKAKRIVKDVKHKIKNVFKEER